MAEMPDPEAAVMGGAGAGHIDGHDLVDAAGAEGPEGGGVPADLLRHGEHLEAETARLCCYDGGVGPDGVHVEDHGVGGHGPRLVQLGGHGQEPRVAPAQDVEEHGFAQ